MRARRGIVVAGVLVVVIAGCDAARTPEPTRTMTTTASPPTTGSPVAGPVTFSVAAVDRFDEPWAMAFLPDTGELLVAERDGALHLRNQNTGERDAVSGVPEVVYAGQGGLGDIVPGPTFAADDIVYLSWVEAGSGGTGAAVGRARLERSTDAAALRDLEVIWRQVPKEKGSGHFGHRIAFSPDGTELFITSGDRQLQGPAQDRSNTLGAIVRLTLDGEPDPQNLWTFEGEVSAEIFSYGHRNPLGIAFAPDGRLWESEMGPLGGDELNLIGSGGNYGWPLASNGSQYDGSGIPDHRPSDGFVSPAVSWNPSISPGSLMIYHGDLFPEWTGDAFLGALSGTALVRVDLDGAEAGEVEVWPMDARIRAVAEDADGVIWLLEDAGAGRLLRLAPD
ncbi:PQQ-dependent sugar dehydrogenase [Microbacterium sp.]|uniref:PQQ-dependent sugar dehydrogenase n=1 Tax=Microbacterium sp. TaxID=51671 RepID=UPI003A87512C